MRFIDKIYDYFRSIDTSDEETDRFIGDKYQGLLQLCLLYCKLDKKFLPITFLQFFLYMYIMVCHWIFGILGLIDTKGINFVLYSKGAYFLLLVQMTIVAMYSLNANRAALVLFHKRMAKNFYDYQEADDGFILKYREENEKEVKMLSVVPISIVAGAVSVFVVAPIFDKYGTYVVEDISHHLNINLPGPVFAYPFSTHTNVGFVVAYCLQLLGGCILVYVIGGGGYLYIVMNQAVRCQLRILIRSIEKIEERAESRYYEITGLKMKDEGQKKFQDRLYQSCFEECLRRNFEHHQIILSSFDCVGQYFSVSVFMAYLTGSAVIALSLLSNSMLELPGTSITSSVLGLIEVGYMAFISYLGQTIIDLNEKLRATMYDTRWYYCSNRVKTGIMIFQQVTLRPMEIACASVVPINLDTFGVVMNSAYSYYNLINAFSAD